MRSFTLAVMALFASSLMVASVDASPDGGCSTYRVGDAVVVHGAAGMTARGVVSAAADGRVTVRTDHGRIVVAEDAVRLEVVAAAPAANVSRSKPALSKNRSRPMILANRASSGGPPIDLLQSDAEKRLAEYIGRPWGEVDPVKTKNYRVWCNSTVEVAENYGRMMEALFDKYMHVFKNFGPKPKVADVWIHANHQQFMDWTGMEPGVGGFYMPTNGQVTAYHGTFGTTGDTYEVLAHEGTHQFQGFVVEDFRAAPQWLTEGLAVFFGDGSKQGMGGKVEIGLIPRDRLLSLQYYIENDSPIWKPETFMLWGRPRMGSYPFQGYATAWGVIYWCLWGNQKEKGWDRAYTGNSGPTILKEYFEPITTNEGWVDLDAEFKRFKQLIVDETKYTSYEAWRDEYRDWIMTLKTKKLFRKKGSSWVSDGLACSVPNMSGWTKLRADEVGGEGIGFQKRGGDLRRIRTWVWTNRNRDALSPALVKRMHDGLFRVDRSHFNEDEMEGVEGDFKVNKNESGAITSLEARFRGAVQGRRESNSSADGSEDEEKSDAKTEIWVVYRASLQKIYANVLEAEVNSFESVEKAFQRYDDRFTYDE